MTRARDPGSAGVLSRLNMYQSDGLLFHCE